MEIVPGFVPGVVKDNADPLAQGRVRVYIPELVEPMSPWWAKPAGWPGAGGAGRGSQYPPPPLEAQVYVIFEAGRYQDPEASAIYLYGMYGFEKTSDGAVAVNPDAITSAPNAEAANSRVCIWEDDSFSVYFTNESGSKKLTLQTKAPEGNEEAGGSYIEIDAAAGTSGKGEYITVRSRTKLVLLCDGLIDISGGVVQIQGRRVMKRGDASGSRGTI